MKAVSIVLQGVLILAIVVAATAAGLPFAQKALESSFESAEISQARSDFLKCSDKILETARTGSGNKCTLFANKGNLRVESDGIYYSLAGMGNICSPQDWALVDINKQIWQKCTDSSGIKTYELRWFYPKNDIILLEGMINVTSNSGSRIFNLYQKGVLFVQFDSPRELSGNSIELTRYQTLENTTVLSINIPGGGYSSTSPSAVTCSSKGGTCVTGTSCPIGKQEISKITISDCADAGKICCKN